MLNRLIHLFCGQDLKMAVRLRVIQLPSSLGEKVHHILFRAEAESSWYRIIRIKKQENETKGASETWSA